jgi:hypothetical protein
MKYSTAKRIVQRMVAGETVSLRRGRFGGISEKTFDAITNVLFHEYGIYSFGGVYNLSDTHGIVNAGYTHKAGYLIENLPVKLF